MKVLIFAGLSKSILLFNRDLVVSMISKGHEVICVGPESDCISDFDAIGARFIQIPFNRYSTNPFTGVHIIKELKNIIKKEHVELYYGFQAVPVTYGVVAASMAKCQNIYAAMTGAGKIVQNRPGFFNKFIRLVLSTFTRISLKKCKRVFFLNEDNLKYFIDHHIVKKEQAVKVNGSGVNVDRFAFKEMKNSNSFLYVGALLRLKGIIDYMEAARLVKKQYPDAKFVVVGGIDIRLSAITESELQQYIDDGTILYAGYQNNVIPFYEQCSVFVLPSYSEGIPTSVIEAMSVGRPIITTNATGCWETVDDGVNGYKVPVGDIEALASKMIWFIENCEDAISMGKKSRDMAEHKFNVVKVNKVMMETMNL